MKIKYLFFIFLLCWSCIYGEPPKAVIFDFGGVMGHVNRKPMFEFLSKTLNISYSKIQRDFSAEILYVSLKKPLSFWRNYAKKPLSIQWHQDLLRIQKEMVQEIPGMTSIVRQIKGQGIRVALLSNTKTYRATFLRSMGEYDLFNPVVLSSDVGVKKPDPKIYRILLSKLKIPPEQCLFIDNRARNIRAGEALGIPGIVFQSPEQLKLELKKREIVL